MHLRRLPQPHWESQVWTCYSCLLFAGSSLSSYFALERPGLPLVFSKAGLPMPHNSLHFLLTLSFLRLAYCLLLPPTLLMVRRGWE